MPKYNRKRKKSANKKHYDIKKILSRLVIFAIVIYFVYAMIWQQVMISKKNDEIEALSLKIDEATKESEKLQKEVENLSDPEYIERVAREELGLVRPNERVFVDSNKSESNVGN